MLTKLFVYLYPDTIMFLKNNQELVDTIQIDTKTDIILILKKFDPFVIIKGKFENNHKARIILQEIEKENYLTTETKFN